MFDNIYEKLQKLEQDVNTVCEFEHIEPEMQDKLYKILTSIENLKGYLDEVENEIMEEDL
jgi:hypothetical protein